MKKVCLILLVGLLISSCAKDDLDRTIFIPDDDDANLPAYTEQGYNTFGAEFDRDYFLVSNKIAPCKIVYKDNQLQFALSGNIRSGNKEMTLMFIFPYVLKDNDYTDLLQLRETKINLADNDCIVKILQEDKETILDVLEGQLYFKRTQLLSVDDQVNRIILSGVFEVRFLQNDFPVNISDGRFDLGITKNVFYSH